MNNAPSTSSFAAIKRQTLEDQRQDLLEEYRAANAQLARTLSDVDRVRLERQLRDLEQRVTKIDEDLAALAQPRPNSTPSGSGVPSVPSGAHAQGPRPQAVVTPALQLEPGQLYRDRFVIRSARGHREGYSVVYQADDRSTTRVVALKLMDAPATAERDKILQCMKKARKFARDLQTNREKGLPKVHDVLEPDPPNHPELCIVQEWVEGDTLQAFLDKQSIINLRDLISMTLSLCETLARLHVQGMVHCDVRPTEIMVRYLSEDPIEYDWGKPVIIDWDKCRETGQSVFQEAIMLRPPYSAPELSTGDPVDQRVDVFSLAMTLLHLLTGPATFVNGQDIAAYVRQRLDQVGQPGLREILKQALSALPRERFETMKAFCDVIRQYEADQFGMFNQAMLDRSSAGISISDKALMTGRPLTPSQRRHMEQEYGELQRRYDTLSRSIAALDTDISRTLEAFRRQPLEETRAERAAERDQVTRRMAEIEATLGR